MRKCGLPIMTNLFYKTVEDLLDQATWLSLLIDTEALIVFLQLISELVEGGPTAEIFPRETLEKEVVIEKACNFLSALASLCPVKFDNPNCLEILVGLLLSSNLEKIPACAVLSSLISFGKLHQPLGTNPAYQVLMDKVKRHCKTLIASGTPRQIKLAIHCLHANIPDDNTRKQVFAQILTLIISPKLRNPFQDKSYHAAVVALGYVAALMAPTFKAQLKTLISQDIVKNLLVQPRRLHIPPGGANNTNYQQEIWTESKNLPGITQSMLSGMKTVARWLIALKTDTKSASNAFKMLTAFVTTGGTFCKILGFNHPFSPAEQAHLRLTAGCTMLKIIQHSIVGDQYTAAQFCTLATLIIDPVPEVRLEFAKKLHKLLSRDTPSKCLPLDFMGYYVLTAYNPDDNQKATFQRFLEADIKLRQNWMDKLGLQNREKDDKVKEQVNNLMPEYTLAFAVAVLANARELFNDPEDVQELYRLKRALWWLITCLKRMEADDYAFLGNTLKEIKMTKNAVNPEDGEANERLYAVCDMASYLITEYKLLEVKAPCPGVPSKNLMKPKLSRMFFVPLELPEWESGMVYLSKKFLTEEQENLKEKREKEMESGEARATQVNLKKRARDELEEVELVEIKPNFVSIDLSPEQGNVTLEIKLGNNEGM